MSYCSRSVRMLFVAFTACLGFGVYIGLQPPSAAQRRPDPNTRAVTVGKLAQPASGRTELGLILSPLAEGDLDSGFLTSDRVGTVLPGVSRIFFPNSATDDAAASNALSENGKFVGVQSDGRIVVVGETGGSPNQIALVRLNTNGTRDTGFGGAPGGKVVIPLPSPSSPPSPGSLQYHQGLSMTKAVMSGDKVIILSSITFGEANGGGAGPCFNGNGSATDFLITVVNADGTLDTAFDGDPAVIGNGNGQVRFDMRGCADAGFGIGVQTDGKIIVGGTSTNSANNDTDIIFFRVNQNTGLLDTSYDGDGKVFFNSPPTGQAPNNELATTDLAVVQTAGANQNKLILFGISVQNPGPHTDFLLNRLNTDGTIDMTFNGNTGFVRTHTADPGNFNSTPSKVVIDGSGRIVAGGYTIVGSNAAFVAARYSADGVPDTGQFASPNGFATIGGFMQGANTCIVGTTPPVLLAADADGRVIIGGAVGGCPVGSNQALARLTNAGVLDSANFGNGGRVVTNFAPVGQSLSVSPNGGTLQPDGKILTVGQVNVPFQGQVDMFAARFLNTPTASTAAGVGVSGRVVSANGRAIRGVRVTLDDGSGHVMSVVTNGFGYYRFDSVEAGSTYIRSAQVRGYTFIPIVVSVKDEITNLDITALP